VRFEKEGKTLIVIDTAGVRKKRHMVTNDIEFYSFHRAERSIRRADVALMLIDGTEPISEPDKKLAQYIAEQYKPVILVLNKWDLTRDRARQMLKEKGRPSEGVDDAALMEQYREYLDQELRSLEFAPIAFITAKEGKNVQGLLDLSQHLFNQANLRVPTHRLNEAIRQIMIERQPSTPSGRRARIYYVTQTEVAPPTILLFVNNPVYFNDSYQRFIINRFRELLPYAEVPIRLIVRARERSTPTTPIDADQETKRPQKPRKRATKPVRSTASKRGTGRGSQRSSKK
jgi:GTPase